MKFATFIECGVQSGIDSRTDWFSGVYLPALRESGPTLRGAVWRSVQTLADMPLKGSHAEDGLGVDYDILLETWFSSDEDFRREARAVEHLIAETGGRFISYRVTPNLYPRKLLPRDKRVQTHTEKLHYLGTPSNLGPDS
jgi:hypothetical protein